MHVYVNAVKIIHALKFCIKILQGDRWDKLVKGIKVFKMSKFQLYFSTYDLKSSHSNS